MYEEFDDENYTLLCPFHDDTNPSLNILKDSGIYHCWSCGASGNLITFVSNFENISYEEAKNKIYGKNKIKFFIKNDRFDKKSYDIDGRYYEISGLMKLMFDTGNGTRRILKDMWKNMDTNEYFDEMLRRFVINKDYDGFYEAYSVIKYVAYTCVMDEMDYFLINKYKHFIKLCKEHGLSEELGIVINLYNSEQYQKYLNEKENKRIRNILEPFVKYMADNYKKLFNKNKEGEKIFESFIKNG